MKPLPTKEREPTVADRIEAWLDARVDSDFEFTYDEVSEVVGFDILLNRTPLYVAKKRIENRHRVLFENVPGCGYRVIHSRDHFAVSDQKTSKARRDLLEAMRALRLQRVDDLSREERQERSDRQKDLGTKHHALWNKQSRSQKERTRFEQQKVERAKPEAKRISKTTENDYVKEQLKKIADLL